MTHPIDGNGAAAPEADERGRASGPLVARAPSSTRCTCAASPTRTATASATWPASAPGSATCATSASTRSGSTRGTPRRWPTAATTSPTTARSTPRSGRSTRPRSSIAEARALGHPHDHRHRPQPRLRPAPVVPAPRWPPARARPSASGSGSGPAGAGRASCRRTAGSPIFGGPAWTRTERRRHSRRVVPAPVRARAARPQLDAPRRPRRARGRPAVLVRPRRRRHPHRLGRPARQGPRRCPRSDRDQRPGAAPATSTATSCTTSTAAGARSPTATTSRACSSARSGCPTPSGFARYLRPGRAAHGVQLRLPGVPVGAGAAARVDRVDARRARAGRRAGDLGALEPRRHPAGDALRPRRHVVRVRGQAVRHADRPRARHAPGPGRGAARDGAAGRVLPLPGRGARAARGRGHPARAAPGPDALRSGGVDPGRDGCRVPLPWAGDAPPYGFSRDGADRALAAAARRLGARSRSRRSRTTATRCSRSTATGLRAPPRRPRARRRAAALAARPTTAVLAFRRGDASSASSTSAADPVALPAGADVLHRQQRRSKEARSRPTPPPGCAWPTHREQVSTDRTARRARDARRKE